MTWNNLVKARMKEQGITQSVLAEKLGKSQGAIALWLNKKREPSLNDIADIMRIVDLDHMVLGSDGMIEYPDEAISNVSKIENQPSYKSRYPVISSVQAGQWSEICDVIPMDEADFIATTEKAHSCSFWLTVEGDSMTSSVGVSFPPGTKVLVDPSIEPENGKFVVAKLDDVNEATFKKYVVDSGQKFLKPLNEQFPIMPINGNCRIVGVVVDAKLKLF
ncbi:LexA family protein [Motilimonas cestriensis]|uniref:LexA family protein n=1 Tax=Motilimonas cestriensis TaxID=2742685 RepID=UPI003DA61927